MKVDKFNDIFELYYKLSLKVAYSVINDKILSEDVAQDVFLTMFFKLDEIEEEYAKAWVLSYSRRMAVDFCRKSYNRHEFATDKWLESSERSWDHNPEEMMIRKEACRRKLDIFIRLKQKNEVWFDLIRRTVVNEENPVSVASDYGISVAYMRTQISRARHWMRKEFDSEWDD